MNEKRIVVGHFSEAYPPLMDGVGQVVKNYADIEKNKYGYDVRIITSIRVDQMADCPNDDNIIRSPMYPFPGIEPYGLTFISRENKKKIWSIDYDIIHTHSPFSFGMLGKKVAKKKGIPYITTFHTQFKQDLLHHTHSRLITNLTIKGLLRHYESADAVTAPNQNSIDVLSSYGFKGHVYLVENATDMKIPTDEEKRIYRTKALGLVNVDTNRPTLLYVGQHKDEKNIPLLIKSLKLLKDKGIKFNMIFVGDGAGRKNYEKMVDEFCLTDYVTFFGETTDREEVAAFYALADYFLFPSKYDTSSLTLREASAFAVPCILVESVTSEEFSDGVNGFVSQDTPEAYAESIASAIEGGSEYRKIIGENAKRTIYKSFDDSVAKLDMIYKRILGKTAVADNTYQVKE